jgi:glycosyltransferase involved in cell wall biosynthesis
MIQVVVPTFNSGGYTRACIDSLKRQDEPFRAWVVNDASYDDTDRIARDAIGGDPRFDYVVNPQNVKSICNIARTLDRMAGLGAAPTDIVCILDGDDYLTRDDALRLVREAYERTGCEASYGTYLTCGGERVGSRDVPQVLRETGDYRKDGWRYNPMRTFQYKVWRHVNQAAYLKMGETFLPDTGDQALFFCILELVGGNACNIQEPLYRVGAVGRSDGASQEECRLHVVGLPPNKRVLNWDGPPSYLIQPPQARHRHVRRGSS